MRLTQPRPRPWLKGSQGRGRKECHRARWDFPAGVTDHRVGGSNRLGALVGERDQAWPSRGCLPSRIHHREGPNRGEPGCRCPLTKSASVQSRETGSVHTARRDGIRRGSWHGQEHRRQAVRHLLDGTLVDFW